MSGAWSELLAIALRHKSYAALFIAAAASTLVLTRLYIPLARRLDWVDRPGGRKQHDEPTPTSGGVVVFAVVFAGIFVAMALPNRIGEMLAPHRTAILAAVLCTTAMIALGLVDDRYPGGVRPRFKLLVQVVVAMAAFLLGYGVSAVTVPWIGSVPLGGLFSPLLTIIWIVGITNAVNLTDGLDGLAAGVGFLAAATNAVVAICLENYYMAVMMILLAGALLGLLRWNFHPARVFLGDAGSLGLGMFLALCSLHSAQKAHTVVMILVPLCALGYPIFDTLLAVARRTLAGQPLMASDRDHIHHRLLARGGRPSTAALQIYAGSLALIFVCLLLSSVNHLLVGAGMLMALGLAVFCVRVLGYFEWAGWRQIARDRDQTRLLHAAAEYARLKLTAARSVDDVLEALGAYASEIGGEVIEIVLGGQTYRWVRHGRAAGGARQRVELDLGSAAEVMGFADFTAELEPQDRAAPLWAELCRLAGERLGAWILPPTRPEPSRSAGTSGVTP